MVAGTFGDATLGLFLTAPLFGDFAGGVAFIVEALVDTGGGGSQDAIRLITTLATLSAETTAARPPPWQTILNAE